MGANVGGHCRRCQCRAGTRRRGLVSSLVGPGSCDRGYRTHRDEGEDRYEHEDPSAGAMRAHLLANQCHGPLGLVPDGIA